MSNRIICQGVGITTIAFNLQGIVSEIGIALDHTINNDNTDFLRCIESSVVAAGKGTVFSCTLTVGGCQFQFSSSLTNFGFVRYPELIWVITSAEAQSTTLTFSDCPFVVSTWYQTPRANCSQIVLPLNGVSCKASQNPPVVGLNESPVYVYSPLLLQILEGGLHERRVKVTSSEISLDDFFEVTAIGIATSTPFIGLLIVFTQGNTSTLTPVIVTNGTITVCG